MGENQLAANQSAGLEHQFILRVAVSAKETFAAGQRTSTRLNHFVLVRLFLRFCIHDQAWAIHPLLTLRGIQHYQFVCSCFIVFRPAIVLS
jgi:hypothetical protein